MQDKYVFGLRTDSINLNILECKCFYMFYKRIIANSINLNILECKWNCKRFIISYCSSINLNILECKLKMISTIFMFFSKY